MRFLAVFAVFTGAILSPALAQTGRVRDYGKSLAPYVASPQPIVDRMLEVAHLKPGETVYDLGCGDGRVLVTAVEKFKAKAVGVELSAKLTRLATETLERHKITEQAHVINANMLDVDLSPADVVTLYLMTTSNDVIRPKLEQMLRAGARVVSHDFEVKGWKPVRVETIDLYNHPHKIYVYEMPAHAR